MALSDFDRSLIARCLSRKPRAWEEFVDRFMGLVIHVINHSAQCRSMRLNSEDREDLVGDVFYTIVKDDFALLRHFRSESSLATYLTVVTRRIVVSDLLRKKSPGKLHAAVEHSTMSPGDLPHDNLVRNGETEAVQRLSDRDEVERLLSELEGAEAQVVRMFHLEGKSYQEISSTVGISENSVGPTLTRARQKMRRASSDSATS